LEENYRGAGINWYIYNLLNHLPDADSGLQYTAFTYEPRFTPRQGMRVRRPAWPTASPLRRIAWEQFVAPISVQRERIDVLHAMAFVSPLLSSCPAVVTVLDLSFVHYPSAIQPGKRLYLRLMTALSVQRARHVIAISECTRRDVIAHLHVPAARVHTVHCGVDPRFRPLPAQTLADFRRRKGLPTRFVLFLGTIEPRKNVVTTIDAFAQLIAADRAATADLHLVVAGARGWYGDDVYARAEARGIADRVHFPGYVPEAQKALWYGAATCFCYPSLYEGFGLPPLEAMACGVPVITSNVSSLPEVVGDSALTVSPDDSAALSAALRRVIADPTLHDELCQKGQARAARFTWTKAARQTVDVYRRALEDG
jgi:glycosyltransferase involved in cell wall biosynthesis